MYIIATLLVYMLNFHAKDALHYVFQLCALCTEQLFAMMNISRRDSCFQNISRHAMDLQGIH